MKKPFLEITDPEEDMKHCPQWLQDGYKEMRKHCPPCSDYAPGCCTCETWIAFMRVMEYFYDDLEEFVPFKHLKGGSRTKKI